MPKQVVTGATTMCTFGLGPSTFNATPRPIISSNMPAGNVMDNKPIVNIVPFPMCNCPANPTVAAATTAAAGVLTPAACVPQTSAGPWMPGAVSPPVQVDGQLALDNVSKLPCMYGGVISITNPGQFTEDIP